MIRARICVLSCAAVFAACAAGAIAQQGPGKISDDVVRIGVLTDMSGLYSDIGGQGSVVAAQMAVDETNTAGGVLAGRSS